MTTVQELIPTLNSYNRYEKFHISTDIHPTSAGSSFWAKCHEPSPCQWRTLSMLWKATAHNLHHPQKMVRKNWRRRGDLLHAATTASFSNNNEDGLLATCCLVPSWLSQISTQLCSPARWQLKTGSSNELSFFLLPVFLVLFTYFCPAHTFDLLLIYNVGEKWLKQIQEVPTHETVSTGRTSRNYNMTSGVGRKLVHCCCLLPAVAW